MRALPTVVLLIIALLGAASADGYGYGRVIAMPGSSTSETIPQSVQKWLDERRPGPFTQISFFVHDVVTGENRTVYDVASAEFTSNSSSSFGKIQVVDNLVTAGPETDSQTVGRVQGTLAFADLHETALSVNFNFIFTHGSYNGSTISIQGRLPTSQQTKQLTIVGGTGEFPLAQGIAILTTFSFDPATVYTVIQYTLFVFPAVGPPRA